MRTDLTPLPDRLKALPLDERGYPVPWFVDWVDGKPEFRAMDGEKWKRALRDRLCWVCGQPLGVHISFVAGPMCGINRISAEPATHLECGRWSAINCPFLNNPEMVRRTDGLPNGIRESRAGVMLTRNPGVAMLWITRTFEIMRVPLTSPGNPGRLIIMGEPSSVEWWKSGKPATRDEVLAAIESGLPALVAIAQQQVGALVELQEARKRFEKWIPA